MNISTRLTFPHFVFSLMLVATLVLSTLSLSAVGTSAEARPAPDGFADLAERLMPAVVNISTSQMVDGRQVRPGQPPMNDFFEEFFRRMPRGPNTPTPPKRQRKVSSLGSGFVIDPAGIIITNNHVIEGADEIVVNFADGTKYDAKILGRDPKTDLAVLKVNAKRQLPFVPMGDSSESRVGDWVIAIGNPFGLGGSLTAGIISAINRDINSGPYDSFIQTDTAINKGNSGGPLFNLDGEVIGVNSAIISPSGGSVGIGFSIPSNLVENVVAQLREYGETRRGWLGVRIQAVTDDLADSLGLDEAGGALVSEVAPDGPAANGGVQVGDVITRFDGRKVAEMRDLPRIVAETKIDKSVKIDVVRRGAKKSLTVVTGRLEEPEVQDASVRQSEDNNEDEATTQVNGLTLRDLSDEARKRFGIETTVKGALVADIDPQSAAFESGIRPGDVITQVDQNNVTDATAVSKALREAKKAGKKSALIFVVSNGSKRFLALELDD
jgi:serine protease Do